MAVAIGIISVFLLWIFYGKRSKKQAILLTGICDAGKTLLFSQLVQKTFKETYTSIKINTASFELPKKRKTLTVIDIPGHERLRAQAMEENGHLARGIIYMIDSSTYQKEIKNVAEYLYVMMCESLASNAAPLLVACNKQDLTFSKGAKIIKSSLEKEINTLRMTRSAALEGHSTTSNNNTFIGKPNKDFDFADISPLKVDFVECSALNKEDDSLGLTQVYEWLEKIG